jgi:hypothetical protein
MSERSEPAAGAEPAAEKGARGSYIPDPAGWGWVRFVLDHNPCFLLSALLMFVGVFLLNAARDVNAAEMGKLLGVLAAVNVYEFAVIGLALLLARRFGIEGRNRDTILLLLIQMLFLTDGGFLINEAVQTSARWGWIVNVILFVLALAKAALALSGLRIRLHLRTLGFLALQLAILYGLPLVLSRVAVAGEVSDVAMYGAWWVVGLLPALYDVIAGTGRFEELRPRQQLLRRSYLVVPWLLLVAHLGFFHYVYRAEFFVADLSPVLLGLAMATRRIGGTAFLPTPHLRVLRIGLPLLALAFSLASPDGFHAVLPLIGTMSPVLITVAAMLVTYAYFISWRAAAWAVIGVTLMAIGHALRGTVTQMVNRGTDIGDRILHALVWLMPSTPTGWGIAAMAAAFVLLALGATISLRPRAGRRSSEYSL